VVYLTDGAASHPGSAMWPRPRLAQARRQEALAALAALGVSPAQVKFLDWPDAAPFDPAGPEYGASLAELALWFEAFAPRSLWAPWRGEAHCDHEAASALADDLQRSHAPCLRRLDYLVWGWAEETLVRSHGATRVLRLPCAASTPQRRRALACHRTQRTDLIRDAEAAFLIPETVAALVDRPSEIFLEHA
jgi:LmbE family N-acetylglucosaminyl deacetylase